MPKQMDLLGGHVVDVPIEDRMQQAFLDYAMSVIVDRALPDVRDGLKPVQRRILYSMWESRLVPDRPYRKCASTVGEVMKKYHPHGDAAIYDALVRMAQDFSSRDPLIDGHGNFGSVDGDPPAAMRYTEARLSALAMQLLAGIDEDTADFRPNYDGYEQEPEVLPARFPNLLVNGATGIAVGMATNIAPHNLGEAIDATLHLLAHPDATLDDLLELLPAPDFPTGARIVHTDGIRGAYATGRGAVTMEAVATTEVRTGNLPRIVVTEIPYQVNKATLLGKIAGLVQDRRIDEIRDLRDESSRDGMRIVIELKRGEDPAPVLEKLYRSTDLRSNFNINCVALVDGAPRTLGLKDCLSEYISHQRQVLTRRTTHRRDQAAARAHVLEGLLTALDHLDEVVALIRAADSADAARTGLVARYELSETQANAILDMQLRRLARLERRKLEDEYRELLAMIEQLEAVLADPGRLDALLANELRDLKRVHATPRRSAIVAEGIAAEDVLAGGSRAGFEAQDVTVYVTRGGSLKPIPQRRTSPAHKHPSDPVVAVLRCTTDHTVLLIDEEGTGYRVDLPDVPVVRPRDRGTHAAQTLGEPPAAAIAGAVVLPDPAAGAGTGEGSPDAVTVVTASAQGQVKRTAVGEYETRARTLQAAGVKHGDRIVAVALCDDDDDLVVAHSGGLVTRFRAQDVRPMGRTATGVIGMDVPDGQTVVNVSVVEGGRDDGDMVTISADGAAKRTPLEEYGVKGRGGKGVQSGAEALLFCGSAADLHIAGEQPAVIRPVELPDARRTARGTDLGVPVGAPVVAEASPVGAR
ncbi:MAG: DNA topoisomerase 4 subunit A [Actinobacteria bacterium]|nr:DNA topoisomerase 4 subunit A [Actinomycetota bacterium]